MDVDVDRLLEQLADAGVSELGVKWAEDRLRTLLETHSATEVGDWIDSLCDRSKAKESPGGWLRTMLRMQPESDAGHEAAPTDPTGTPEGATPGSSEPSRGSSAVAPAGKPKKPRPPAYDEWQGYPKDDRLEDPALSERGSAQLAWTRALWKTLSDRERWDFICRQLRADAEAGLPPRESLRRARANQPTVPLRNSEEAPCTADSGRADWFA